MHKDIRTVSLGLHQQDRTGEKSKDLSIHAHTHLTDRWEQNTDARTHTQNGTLLRGPGLHFTAVCPTSFRSASFHVQQRHGKKMDWTERQRKQIVKLSWLESEDVNKSGRHKRRKKKGREILTNPSPNRMRCHFSSKHC